jgi:uncharacterized DUF497 family protein
VRELRVYWDPEKAAANLKKHGVSFEEAREAMADPLARSDFDDRYPYQEQRFWLIGRTFGGKLLLVAFTILGDVARIIHARAATPKERRMYMKEGDMIRDASIDDDEMPDEVDMSRSVRGLHSFPMLVGTVTLASDVYDVFRTSEEVNTALRMLIREGRVPHISLHD